MSERREERNNQETALFGKVLAFGPQSGNTSAESPLTLTTRPLDPMLMTSVPKQGALWPSMETLAQLNPFFAVYGQASSYYPLLYPPTYTTGLFASGSGGMMPATHTLRPPASDFLASLPKPLLTPAFALPTSLYNPPGGPSGNFSPIPRIRVDANLDRALSEPLQRTQALPCSASPEQFGIRALATSASSMTSLAVETKTTSRECITREIRLLKPLLVPGRLCLDFKSSTWQNRPSRIYFDCEHKGLDRTLLQDLDLIPHHLVLSRSHASNTIHQLVMDPSLPETYVHHYQPGQSFFELQVWHRTGSVKTTPSGPQPEPTLILDAYHPNANRPNIDFKLLRVSLAKSGPFFTIQGNKGLKVHDLFLVCVLQLGSTLYISHPTAFPSSESRRSAMHNADESPPSPQSPLDGAPSSDNERFTERRSAFDSSPTLNSSFHMTTRASASAASMAVAKQELANTQHTISGMCGLERLSSDLLSTPSFAHYMPKLSALIKTKVEHTSTPFDTSEAIFGSWICSVYDSFGLEFLIDAILIPFTTEPWFYPALNLDSVKALLKSSPNAKNGVFIVYISTDDRPQLRLAGLSPKSENHDDNAFLIADISCGLAPSLRRDDSKSKDINPSFWLLNDEYKASTQATEIGLLAAKFASASGWRTLM